MHNDVTAAFISKIGRGLGLSKDGDEAEQEFRLAAPFALHPFRSLPVSVLRRI